MAYTVYNCTALTGGAERALDALAVAGLAANDRAFCVVSGIMYIFSFSTGTAAEQTTTHPYIIRPDDYGASGNWTELINIPIGAANYKQFMNAAGTAPEWASGIKIGTFTKDTAIADNGTAITGVGFKPSHVIFLALISGTSQLSIGFDDGTTHYCLYNYYSTTPGAWAVTAGSSMYLSQTDVITWVASITALGADGFTYTWVKTGAKTGTVTVYFMAFR